MLIRFLRFLLGYVKFSIKGEFPERLLNQLSFKGISVWNISREDGVLTACVKASDYKMMLKLKGKNRVCTRILSRNGFVFWVKKYRLRWGFAFGIGLFAATLFFLSNFVWNIQIVGNESIKTAEIKKVLYELGLAEGVKISSIDQQALPQLLALKIDGISWASVNIEGVKVTVNISESIKTEKPSNEPCNLIAKCDGIITKTEVKNGTTVVSLGQTVQKGDLLVSGFTEYKDGSASLGAAKGEIIAKTERELSVFVPFEQVETVVVGDPETRHVLNVFGIKIPLYLGSVKGNCDVAYSTKIFEKNGMYLPIFISSATFTPINETSVVLSIDEAKSKAEILLTELEKAELENVEIVQKESVVIEEEGGVTLTAKYVCRENIAECDLILIYETE